MAGSGPAPRSAARRVLAHAGEVPWVALLPFTLVLPILESNPLRAAHSLWAPISMVMLVPALRSLPRTRWRAFWLWVLAVATVGTIGSAQLAGASLSAAIGPVMAVGSVVGTAYFVRAMALRGPRYVWTATGSIGAAMLIHTYQILPLAPDAAGNPWKFGIGYSVSIIVLSACAAAGRTWLEVAAALVLAAISFSEATRALGVVLALAAMVVAIARIARGRPTFTRIGGRLCVGAALGLTAFYGADAVLNSELFASSAERFAEQAEVNDNSLLAGRTEPPISIAAISESPFVGMGPEPHPTPAIVDRAIGVAQHLGYRQIDQLVKWWTQDDTIYVHSVLADTWVRSGVLAAALYLAALLCFVATVVRGVLGSAARPALAIFMVSQSVWDVIFSPAAYGQLVLIGLAIGMCSVTMPRTPPGLDPETGVVPVGAR
ncbi:hypothetical protein GCM10023175_59680 [Pseudonocardia xishanensis]|uniref:O-antigen ligase-related domain-containing protein n=1 Tax=Pseudonocardia xishanensis TaxID=630995 RepID=A0ABP8S0D2_9PSEU